MKQQNTYHQEITRRTLLGSVAVGAAAMPALARRAAGVDGFDYEVARSEEDWRSMLDAETYGILRDGETEWPKSSSLWEERREGTYHCRGCDLPVFTSRWQVPIDKGWVFFKHSEPNAVLTGIDGPVEQYGMADMGEDSETLVEIHCRRCGSHLGHYLFVALQNVHCINGKALRFEVIQT